MKKILLVLLLLFVSLSVFSASSESTSFLSGEGLSAELNVSINPGVFNNIDVGFSRNEIVNYDDEVLKIEDGETEDLTVADASAYLEDSIYVYWKIRSSNKVSASLSILSALKGLGGEIDWSISLKDGSKSISSEDKEQELPIISATNTYGNVGSAELLINSNDLSRGNIVPGTYIGDLRLNIAIE